MLKTTAAEKVSGIGSAGMFFVSMIGGFLLAETKIAGAVSFANISLAGALSLPLSAAVLSGSIVRYIIAGTIPSSIVQLTAMIICVIYKMFFESKSDAKYCGISTAVSVFAAGTAVSAVLGELLYKLLFYAVYGALAGITAYAAALIIGSLRHQLILDLSSTVSCAYAIVYTVVIASLCSAEIPYINIGIILGIAVTVTAAYHYRSVGGVICGALTACGAFLASSTYGMSVVMLPASGLLTGYLYRQKAGAAAGFFTAISIAFMILTGVTANSIFQILNIICGTVIFLMISQNFSDKWVFTGRDGGALPNILGSRMSFLASSIETVRRESGKISEVLSRNADKSDEIERNSAEVCTHCHRRLACWYNSYDATRRAFRKMSELYEITQENFPYELEECLHKEELVKAFERTAREKMTAKLLSLRFAESQRLLFEQIKIIEEIVEAAGERIDVRYSEPISKTIRDKLTKYNFNAKNVIAYYNSQNRLLVELYFDYQDAPKNCVRICDLIADELKLNLDYIEPINSGKEVRIRVFESPAYMLEAYGASLCAENSGETGDTSAVFSDGTGISYAILSDGMGSGRSAAIESRMVVTMFKKLIGSGVNYHSAIKLINSIMLTKSREEAFATLDAVRIDLDTCELTIIKSGASATLIRHRGQVMKISSPTFPIGIVEETNTFSQNYEFEENDIIIMFSDGINENEYQFIKELLLSSEDLKYIVDEICAKADLFNSNLRPDDITVIGLRVTKL
ncbi:MAG: SpoIIE family protein phosphatase [Ruminococcus sp.]|nr:SpoIIE family protein phosphatase [Ruminococcus sp.]